MHEVMTAKELADYLQLNELTIYRKTRLGLIPSIKLGRALRFKKEVIDNWLEIESGWDQEFETLLSRSHTFGKKAKITTKKIQQAIENTRKQEK